jgi:hypothetical protein
MKVTPRYFLGAALVAVAALALVPTVPAQAELVGLWEFENGGGLTSATIGADLALTGSEAAVAGSGNGADAGASQLAVGDYYTVTHGIGANGGGSCCTNEFTILWDVMYPAASAGSWKTLWQTAQPNNNDGDLFIRPSGPQGAIGTGDTGYSANTTSADTWYRIVASVDSGSHFRVYVNGNEWLDGVAQPVDGRFSLDPTFHVFADNDGDDALMSVSNLAIWDSALDANAVGALGGAGRAIPVPEPAALLMALLAMAGAFGFRRR